MDREQAERFAAEWLTAWNSRDLDRILVHYAEDVLFISPFAQRIMDDSAGVVRGKAALREYFRKGLAAYPSLRFELIRVLAGVDSVVLYYRGVNDLYAAEMMELDTDGRIRRASAHYAAGEAPTPPSRS